MYIIDNYSHEYKTRRILDLDKILLPDSLHLNTILAEQNLDPLWCHSNLVTFPIQKKAVTAVTELIHCNQPISFSSSTFMFERTNINK